MLGLTKKKYIGLYIYWNINASNHTKCLSLSNQNCMSQSTLINLHSNEYNQKFHYNPFAVNLDRYVGSWNTLKALCNNVCVPNKTEDLGLSVFKMITGIVEQKHWQNIYHANVHVD